MKPSAPPAATKCSGSGERLCGLVWLSARQPGAGLFPRALGERGADCVRGERLDKTDGRLVEQCVELPVARDPTELEHLRVAQPFRRLIKVDVRERRAEHERVGLDDESNRGVRASRRSEQLAEVFRARPEHDPVAVQLISFGISQPAVAKVARAPELGERVTHLVLERGRKRQERRWTHRRRKGLIVKRGERLGAHSADNPPVRHPRAPPLANDLLSTFFSRLYSTREA
eukprot:scaffold28138_cov28-Tisochrysis_lutea.AAC.1